MKIGLPAARVIAAVKRSSRERSWSASRSSAAIASMFRAASSETAGDGLPANGVCGERPPLAPQPLGNRRVPSERVDARLERFGGGARHIPVWNERQSVGSVLTFTVQLAGQQLVVALEDPAQEPNRAAFAGISLHALSNSTPMPDEHGGGMSL